MARFNIGLINKIGLFLWAITVMVMIALGL